MELTQEPFKLNKTVDRVIKLFSIKAKQKEIALNLAYDSNLPQWLTGDWGRIRQILMNLVGNAIKFTKQGYVSLTITCQEKTEASCTVCFCVEDTGIGISEPHLEQIFDKFSQAESSINRKFGGTGLGLAITKELIQLMGGNISVESKLREGSKFKAIIPFEISPSKAINKTIEKKNNNLISQKQIKEGYSDKTISELNLKILLAEDNPVNQKLAEKALAKMGCKLEVADNGKIAVDKFKKGKYDFVFMDIQMPVMNGYEATEQIREFEKESRSARRTPIIAVTAHAMNGNKEQAQDAGMDGYITKPVKLKEIENILKSFIPKAHQA